MKKTIRTTVPERKDIIGFLLTIAFKRIRYASVFSGELKSMHHPKNNRIVLLIADGCKRWQIFFFFKYSYKVSLSLAINEHYQANLVLVF